MKRLYLSPTGAVRPPTEDENSHYGIAQTELGPTWAGNSEDAYIAMWEREWVRVVDYGDKVYAERYVEGLPVMLTDLPRKQREWLEGVVLSGKALFWNEELFSLTSEAKQGQTPDLVSRLMG